MSKKVNRKSSKTDGRKMSGGARRRSKTTGGKKRTSKSKKTSKTSKRSHKGGARRRSKKGTKRSQKGGNPLQRQDAVKQASPPEKLQTLCEIPSSYTIDICHKKEKYEEISKLHSNISNNMSCKTEHKKTADTFMRECDKKRMSQPKEVDGYAVLGKVNSPTTEYTTMANIKK
jgi:hypothetical protein